jgi:PAS domain-containing protein
MRLPVFVWLSAGALLWGAVVSVVTYWITARQLRAGSQRDRDRAEAALRQSEEKFRRLVEANLIGVTVSSLDGQIFEANDCFLAMVGYGRDDLKTGAMN